MLFLLLCSPILLLFSISFAFDPHQKSCPVRIVSHRLFSGPQRADGRSAGEGPKIATNIWRHFSTDKESIYNQQQRESTVEMPGPNNSAILYSEHFEPDSESSLTANFKCQFIFIGAPDERVQIIFHWFRLRLSPLWSGRRRPNQTSLRCEESDHLSAHVLLEDRMTKIVDFCGDELPAQLMSAKNVLTLTYVLKSALMKHQHFLEEAQNGEKGEGGGGPAWQGANGGDHFGWIAEYRFLTDYGIRPAEAIAQENSSCSFLFNGTLKATGNVWSPNYPGFYPRNVDCQYVFIGSKEQIVLVTFEYFDVEGYGQCDDRTQSDFVLFSNYQSRDRTNRRFCGALRPKGAIQSESNYFRMIFHSNDIFDGTGFYARYQFFNENSSKNRVKLAPSSSNGVGNVWPGLCLPWIWPFHFILFLFLISQF